MITPTVILLLILSVIFICVQEVIKKGYLIKHQDGNDSLYNLVAVLFAIPIFIIAARGSLSFHAPTLIYACGYALCYACALIFTMKALSEGSMALTVMVLSFSFAVSMLSGIVFFGEWKNITVFNIISLVLLVVTMLLMCGRDNKGQGCDEEGVPSAKKGSAVSKRWLIYVALATLGNGSCSTVVKLHREKYPDSYSNELMISALIFVLLICFIILLYKGFKQGESMTRLWRPTLLFAGLTGICNGVANLLTVVLIERMDLTAHSIVTRCGTFILTFLISVLLYKEKMSLRQKIAFFLGVAAVLIYSI